MELLTNLWTKLYHVTYLKGLGLVVNENKTEAVVFTKKDCIKTETDISGVKVTTKEVMKVLGVKFDSNLSWGPHIKNTQQKYRSKLGILKKIRNRFTKEQFLNITTAQYYSHLYYCTPVWYNDSTSYPVKRLMNTAHYRPLKYHSRITDIDYQDRNYSKSAKEHCLLNG